VFEEVGWLLHQYVEISTVFILHYERVKQEIAPLRISFFADYMEDFIGSVGKGMD
jgi:hypothetical protein